MPRASRVKPQRLNGDDPRSDTDDWPAKHLVNGFLASPAVVNSPTQEGGKSSHDRAAEIERRSRG